MGVMTPGFEFTGSVGNLSAYRMRGSDKIIIRTKGGASKEKIKKAPEFELTRRNNHEFGGRSTAVKWLRRMMHPVNGLADYNIAGSLNALLKPIQVSDTVNEKGKRNVCISKAPHLLEGFNCNKHNSFDSIVRNPVRCTISKETLTATIASPELMHGINFFIPGRFAFFSMVVSFGVVPDLFYGKDHYEPAQGYSQFYPETVHTNWQPVLKGAAAETIEITLNTIPPDTNFSLMVSIGIRFGTMGENDEVLQLKRVGAGKVLGMG